MTVDELIRELTKLPGDSQIEIFDYRKLTLSPVTSAEMFNPELPAGPDNPAVITI